MAEDRVDISFCSHQISREICINTNQND